MKATFFKRFTAYIIDMIIISSALILIFNLFPENKSIGIMRQELNNVYEKVLTSKDNLDEYFQKFVSLNHKIDKELVMHNVVNAIVIIGYFTLIPYLFMGQTPGKRFLGIRIVRDDGELLALNDLVYRSFIVHGLSYLLISLMLIYLVPSVVYFLSVTILGFIQFALVLISCFMIMIRKDKLGIQDLISKTCVVEDK